MSQQCPEGSSHPCACSLTGLRPRPGHLFCGLRSHPKRELSPDAPWALALASGLGAAFLRARGVSARAVCSRAWRRPRQAGQGCPARHPLGRLSLLYFPRDNLSEIAQCRWAERALQACARVTGALFWAQPTGSARGRGPRTGLPASPAHPPWLPVHSMKEAPGRSAQSPGLTPPFSGPGGRGQEGGGFLVTPRSAPWPSILPGRSLSAGSCPSARGWLAWLPLSSEQRQRWPQRLWGFPQAPGPWPQPPRVTCRSMAFPAWPEEAPCTQCALPSPTRGRGWWGGGELSPSLVLRLRCEARVWPPGSQPVRSCVDPGKGDFCGRGRPETQLSGPPEMLLLLEEAPVMCHSGPVPSWSPRTSE